MLATALIAVSLIAPNTEQWVVSKRVVRRPDPALNTRQRKLSRLRAPMAPRIQLLPATPDIKTYAAADGPGGIIYSQGPLDDLTMAHEQYHLLDSQVMTDADRRRFSMILGRNNDPWDIGTSSALGDEQATPGYRNSVSEQFADMAAMVALHRDPKGKTQDYGYMDRMPTRKQLLRFGRALERLGKRYGLDEYKRPA